MVERTAHDGFVVGSNPTKPKSMEKQKNFKYYKTLRLKSILKKENTICIVSMTRSSTKDWVNFRSIFSSQGIKILQVNNLELVEVLQGSVLANYVTLISGSTAVITMGNNCSYLSLAELQSKITKKALFLGVVVNNKVYLSNSLLKTKHGVSSASKTLLMYSLRKKKTLLTLSKQQKGLLKLACLKKTL